VTIDWNIAATIAAPTIALFVGAALDRVIERRPKLIAYLAHTSAFRLAAPPHTQVHTHSIVIRNTGRRAAFDIRVSHFFLPDNFYVFPDTEYTVAQLPGGNRDIVFNTLPPGDQITISYLYFPPVLFNQINGLIRHRDGIAMQITVLPTPQYPRWLARSLWALIVLGAITAGYLLYELIARLVAHLH
jgi:hypothetical protein